MSQLEQYRLGPCWIYTAPDVTDELALWASLGFTRGNVVATVQPGRLITNRVDQIGAIPYAAATYKFGDILQLGFPLLDKQIDTLLKVAPGSVKLTASAKDAFAFTKGVASLNGRAFALVPVDEFTENDPWWDAEHVIWMYKGIANINDRIDTFKRAESDDLGPYEVTVTHIDDANGRGGIGPVWIEAAGTDVLGFATASETSHRVTNADTEGALNTAGFTTMRSLVDNTGAIDISGNTPALTDLAGLEYAFRSSSINVSSNNVSQANMSDFIDRLWEVRMRLGLASCVINISLNNGVDADATARINGTGAYLYAIAAVDQTNKTFTVSGDQRGKFPATRLFSVEGSTGNDGTYTVAAGLGVEYDPDTDQTRIPVDEAIPNATADGSVNDGLVGAGCTVTT